MVEELPSSWSVASGLGPDETPIRSPGRQEDPRSRRTVTLYHGGLMPAYAYFIIAAILLLLIILVRRQRIGGR